MRILNLSKEQTIILAEELRNLVRDTMPAAMMKEYDNDPQIKRILMLISMRWNTNFNQEVANIIVKHRKPEPFDYSKDHSDAASDRKLTEINSNSSKYGDLL